MAPHTGDREAGVDVSLQVETSATHCFGFQHSLELPGLITVTCDPENILSH